MTKPNKKEIAAKLEAWAKNERKRLRTEADRDLELEPHVTRCQRAIAPINEEFDLKLSPLNETKRTLEAEIISLMEAGIDREKETVALSEVDVARALVRVNVSDGSRFIDPEGFFKFTPPANRNAKFWECVTIPIGKASKFLGSAIERLATKPKKFEVKLSLKD
jgi:hypothetical protein